MRHEILRVSRVEPGKRTIGERKITRAAKLGHLKSVRTQQISKSPRCQQVTVLRKVIRNRLPVRSRESVAEVKLRRDGLRERLLLQHERRNVGPARQVRRRQ